MNFLVILSSVCACFAGAINSIIYGQKILKWKEIFFLFYLPKECLNWLHQTLG